MPICMCRGTCLLFCELVCTFPMHVMIMVEQQICILSVIYTENMSHNHALRAITRDIGPSKLSNSTHRLVTNSRVANIMAYVLVDFTTSSNAMLDIYETSILRWDVMPTSRPRDALSLHKLPKHCDLYTFFYMKVCCEL